MKLILTHVNSDLPPYIVDNFKHLRKINPSLDICIICHNKYLSETSRKWLNEYDIHPIFYELYEQQDLVQEFRKVSWYKAFGTPNTKYPSPKDFVQGTTERLYALNAYLQRQPQLNVFHIENDVLVYERFDEIFKITNGYLYDKLMLTPMANDGHTFSFSWIPNHTVLDDFCRFNLKIMQMGEPNIRKKYGIDFVCEMQIAKIYGKETDALDYFPILPTCRHFELFNACFDPASYGQYLGGTNNFGNEKGWAGNHHIVGRQILSGAIEPRFDMTDRVPFGIYTTDDNTVLFDLNTLHVHSKNLKEFS